MIPMVSCFKANEKASLSVGSQDLSSAPEPLIPTHLGARWLLLVSPHLKALVFAPEMSPSVA